jgi:ribosomal protein S12 methylthiotransferase
VLFRSWRKIVPALTVRSTFIAGFPGETEAQFEDLLAFLKEAELDRVGCFAYSPVEGATANELDGALPDEVREDRRKRFMQVQQRISRRLLKRKVGSVQRVLIDAAGPEGAIGRSSADAPEIDGVVHIAPHSSLKAGGFVDVVIEASDAHDLFGAVAGTESGSRAPAPAPTARKRAAARR